MNAKEARKLVKLTAINERKYTKETPKRNLESILSSIELMARHGLNVYSTTTFSSSNIKSLLDLGYDAKVEYKRNWFFIKKAILLVRW